MFIASHIVTKNCNLKRESSRKSLSIFLYISNVSQRSMAFLKTMLDWLNKSRKKEKCTNLKSVTTLVLMPCIWASVRTSFSPFPSILMSSRLTGSMEETSSSGMPFVKSGRLISICFRMQSWNLSPSSASHGVMYEAVRRNRCLITWLVTYGYHMCT